MILYWERRDGKVLEGDGVGWECRLHCISKETNDHTN